MDNDEEIKVGTRLVWHTFFLHPCINLSGNI